MYFQSLRKLFNPFIAALSLVALFSLSPSCRAGQPDRATRAAEVFNAFCLSTPPDFSEIDRRATEAHYQIIVDRILPTPDGKTVRQKNWLIPSSGGAATMLTTVDGTDDTPQVFACGIYAPDIAGASIERALSLLPRLGSPTKQSHVVGDPVLKWWLARVGDVLPSENSQVMLTYGRPGMPGSNVILIFKTPSGH